MPQSSQPLTVDDFEEYAKGHLPRMVRDYFNGGAMDSITLAANREAYQRYSICPRVLRNVSNIKTATTVFEDVIPFPLCIAPAAMQK